MSICVSAYFLKKSQPNPKRGWVIPPERSREQNSAPGGKNKCSQYGSIQPHPHQLLPDNDKRRGATTLPITAACGHIMEEAALLYAG